MAVNNKNFVIKNGLDVNGKVVSGDQLNHTNISNALDRSSANGIDAYRPINLIDSSGVIKVARVHDTYGGGLDIFQWDSTISNVLSRSLIVAEGGLLKLLNETEGGDIVLEAKPSGGSRTEHLRVTSGGNVGIGTDSNLTANLTIGNIEETSTTNKGALAIKTLANSDTDVGHSAIYIEEPTSGYGFYTKVSVVNNVTSYQIGTDYSFGYDTPFTISDVGDVGIGTNYTDGYNLKILAEDQDVIKIENTNNSIWGSEIRVLQDSNSPAANDKLFTLNIRGKDSGGTQTTYTDIISSIEDPTDGSESGKFTIQTQTNGTLTDRIVVDSGGVGIGTNDPTNAALHVAGRNLSLGGPGYNFSGESNLWLGDYNNPANNTYDPNIRVGTANQFQFEIESDYGNGTRSNNLFYVDPNSVGFNVYGDSNSPGTIFYYSYSRTATDQYLFLSANSKYLWFAGDTGRLGINRSSGSGWTDTLDVNGTARVTGVAKFDSNVGIATDTPKEKLHVEGNIYFNNFALITNYDSNGISGSNIDHIWHNDTGEHGTGGSWNFISDGSYKSTSNYSNINVGHVHVNNGNLGTTVGDTQYLAKFYAYNGNATSIIIRAKRNVAGNNWNSAGYRIFCNTDVTEQGYIEFNPHTTTAGDGNYDVAIGSKDGEIIRFTTEGNVGIGTITPGAKLAVHGTGTVASFGDLTNVDQLDIVATAGYPSIRNPSSADTLQLDSLGNVKIAIDSNNNSTANFKIVHGGKDSGGNEILSIDESGNFKVSQAVSGWPNSTNHPIIMWDYKSSVGDMMYMASGGNTSIANQMALVISDGDGFKVGRSGWDGTEPDIDSSNEFFRISTSGNVGIGTASPSHLLHLDATLTASNISSIFSRAEVSDTNVDTSFNIELNTVLSGTNAATSDREQGGIHNLITSTATGGDTNHEHRCWGIWNDLNVSGDSDLVYGTYNDLRIEHTSGTVGNVRAAYNLAQTTSSSTTSNLIGSYNIAQTTTGHSGTCSSIYGVFTRTNNAGTAGGTVGNMYSVYAEMDNDAGISNTGTTALFRGDYVVTTNLNNPYGLYITDETYNYLSGNLGLGLTGATQKLDIDGNIRLRAGHGIICDDDGSIPDNPTNQKTNLFQIRDGSGGLFQVSGRGAVMLASADDGLVLANGDVGYAFTNSHFNVAGENTWLLSDSSVYIWTNLQSGFGNENIFTFASNGDFTAAGNVTAYSDITLKENIEVIQNPIEKISKIRGVTFNRTDNVYKGQDRRFTGVIAQEVEEVLPEVVSEDEKGIKSVSYGNMVGLLIEAIKEQQNQIDSLKEEIKTLKGVE